MCAIPTRMSVSEIEMVLPRRQREQLARCESIELADDREVWERQPDETDAAWAVFRAYRDLPPERRSQDAALELSGINISRGPIMNFSRVFRWVDRAAAYDHHIDKHLQQQLAARRIRARVEAANVGQVLRERAAEALNELKTIVTEEVMGDDGELRTIVRSALSPNEIARLAEIGVKLERQALGLDQEGGGVQVGVQVNVQRNDGDLFARAQEIISSQQEVVDVTAQMLEGNNGDG
jgi:hypothetical protein